MPVFSQYISLLILCLMVGQTNGQTFTDVAVELGIDISIDGSLLGVGCSFYDFDEDGWDDISVAQFGTPPLFFRNTGDGFEEVDLGISNDGEIKHILWVDFDNDGDPDLFLSKYLGQTRLYRNDGNLNLTDISDECGFDTNPAYTTWGCAWGDYNLDGYLDVYWASYEFGQDAFTNLLYQNNGDGTFSDVTDEAGVSNGSVLSFQPIWIDHGLDGDQDIHLINDRYAFENVLFSNEGDGTFSDLTFGAGLDASIDAMSNSAMDFDRDGDLDLYITNSVEGNILFQNNGDGTYSDIASEVGLQVFYDCWTSNWVDFDNDGWEDVYVVTAYGDTDTLQNLAYLNQESSFVPFLEGGFGDDQSLAYCAISGDINNDGFVDIYMPAEAGPYPTRMWQNDATSSNNYLKIGLEGVVSNRDGIGSWIKAFIGDTVLVRYTLCGEDYLCQDSQREIIGLGQNATVDSLEITWLSGHRDVFYDVAANQTLHILEGSSIPESVSVEQSFCVGDTLFLDAGPYVDFLWNTGDTTQVIAVTAEGSYWADMQNEFGLELGTDTFNVSWFPQPALSFEITPVSCNGSADAIINIINDSDVEIVTYIWSTDDITAEVTNLGAGEYSCFVETEYGCGGSIPFELVDPAELTMELTIVDGDDIQVSADGGWGDYQYFWTLDGEPAIEWTWFMNDVEPGSHSVLVRDLWGCEISEPFVITDVNELWGSRISIFPIPADNLIRIEGLPQGIYSTRVFSISGQMCSEALLSIDQPTIDISELASGPYFLSITNFSGQTVNLPFQKL